MRERAFSYDLGHGKKTWRVVGSRYYAGGFVGANVEILISCVFENLNRDEILRTDRLGVISGHCLDFAACLIFVVGLLPRRQTLKRIVFFARALYLPTWPYRGPQNEIEVEEMVMANVNCQSRRLQAWTATSAWC